VEDLNYDNMLSRFHPIPERNGQTDGRIDTFAISISRVSVLTRDKNPQCQVVSASHKEGMLNWWQSLKPEIRV